MSKFNFKFFVVSLILLRTFLANQEHSCRCKNLFLQTGGLEGEQELLHVVFSQLVDAAGVDGSSQEFIHFVLGVHRLLDAAAVGRRRTFAADWCCCAAAGWTETVERRHLLVFTWSLIDPLEEKEENAEVRIRPGLAARWRSACTKNSPFAWRLWILWSWRRFCRGPSVASAPRWSWLSSAASSPSSPSLPSARREEHVSSAKCSRSVSTTCWMRMLKKAERTKKKKRPFRLLRVLFLFFYGDHSHTWTWTIVWVTLCQL